MIFFYNNKKYCMKKEQIIEVCQGYDDFLEKEGFIVKHREPDTIEQDLNHVRWMLNEIPKMLENPCKIEKINRWLGFAQGVMWIKGFYSIDEMKGHNRSGNECKDQTIPENPNDQFYWYEGGFMMYGD